MGAIAAVEPDSELALLEAGQSRMRMFVHRGDVKRAIVAPQNLIPAAVARRPLTEARRYALNRGKRLDRRVRGRHRAGWLDEGQHPVEPRLPQHLPHLTAAAEDGEVEAVLASRGVDLQQHPQTRRVDELEAAQIQQERTDLAVEPAAELLLKALIAGEIELTRESEDRRLEVALASQRAVLAEPGRS